MSFYFFCKFSFTFFVRAAPEIRPQASELRVGLLQVALSLHSVRPASLSIQNASRLAYPCRVISIAHKIALSLPQELHRVLPDLYQALQSYIPKPR